ncbi:LPXTG-motif cell wall anchor domain protein [Streptococcus mitis]|uniref:LPXTG-motif cell wall anchor domain protein n=2 Tax=Streptococcus mitis TaxID=28037 RepID=A0A081S8R5_STRMT|nr:LPXTG-motif cell wall anchor domain protein [Streptococcus mitis]
MFFNRKGINQKNWRMIKKGKHFLFGCTLFLTTGAVMIQNPHLVHADEMVASLSDSTKVKDEDPNSDKIPNDVENHPQVENPVKESDKISEHVPEEKILEKSLEHPVKAVDKTALNELIEKIRNTDLQTKTAKSVENLNLSLSRAQAVLDKEGASQDEIDKEVQALSESFAQLEEKSNDIDKKEKQADKANDSDEKKNPSTEKIAKVQALVSEINQLAGEISYEFSESESKSLQVFADLSEGKATESEVDGALNEAKSLRNKVANRVTRAQSGKRDPRNGKPIDGKGESGFRAIWISSIANKYEGSNALVNENKKELTFYNSDTLFSVMTAYGKRGNGEPLVRYPNGPKRGEEDPTPYYVKRVGVISGLNQVKGLKLRVAYKNFQTGKKEEVDIAANYWNVNNPEVQMALVGTIGDGGNVTPGTYHITIGANGTHKQNTITYTLTIKPQSERNTVRDLTPTYVDDVRHLTETEKNALIEKFKAEHPNVVNRANHIDFDHAEVSADGATMTIHFKDGFNPKTIQTNATNDVEAKHSSLTAYFGDSKELYTNPRELVRSKTGHEVPTTAQVTYKTPFNLQEAGTRNVVVTTTYENGVTKDVTTPYTVLDFLGKQDKKINQNQSGQLGDARNYVTVSDNSAVPGELTVRWKGGSSNVDTSAAGVQHKEIEILRGSHLMKTVNVPVEIVDNIKPTITAPDNITLTRLEGLPSEINIHAQDNDKGVGLKESNSVTVDNLPNPLSYNAKKSKIEINGVIPNNFQLGKSSIQVTVKAVDKKENTATKNITFHIQSQTQKYTAVANSQIQEVSYGEAPDAGTSIQKNGLPTGTRYGWATQPNTATGPGDQTEVVTVTYPDGSTDTVPVTVKVRKLSDEHIPTGKTITVNQNDPVTNDRLKAAVTVDNGGTRKVKSVTAAPISTVHAGSQTIKATVTYLDNTTDPVDIPLEVKDVTPPTIQTPAENTNWEVTALDKALPNMEVRAEDNENGSGIKNVTVTGLPDYLDYDSPTHTIKFKSGKDAVEKLSGNTPSQEFTLNIRAEDKAGNVSERTAKITVSSMSAKTNPTPIPQNTSYGQVPDSNASVDKAGLPDGTKVTWKTPPVVNTPGTTTGVAEVTYPDGSKDVVTVNVTVRKVSEDFTATGTQIEVNQNVSVTPEMLKGAVTATNAQGENGNSKIATVESKTPINTEAYGDQTIQAKVTYIDGSEQDVTIPLKVKDVTDPTIQTPANGQNIDLIALDKAFSPIKVTSEDNAGGSGVQSTTVTDLPDFLTYDDATKTIKFKADTQEVPKLPVGTDSQTHTATIRVTDNANNSSTSQLTFTVKSMTTKYDATANPQKQTVSYGETPDAGTSVNKTNLPEGTSYAWKTTPVTTDGPREKDGVVEVIYKDGSKDTVDVKVTVKELSSEYEVTGAPIEVNQNVSVTSEMLKGAVTATNAQGEKGNAKIATVEAKTPINTEAYGDQTIQAKVTYIDGSEQDVTIPLKVKDATNPTISAPAENTNWEMTALDKTLPLMKIEAKDNANGSGVATIEVNNMPSFLTFDQASGTIVFKEGVREVPRIDSDNVMYGVTIVARDKAGNSTSKLVNITVSSMRGKYSPTAIAQEVDNGHVPDPETSVNKTGLPEGTTVTWKTRPDVSTPGSHPGVALVHYPDGTEDEVEIPVTVKKQSDTFNPTAKEPNQTVRHNEVPDPEKSINTNDLPKGTNYSWSEQPDTSKPGSKTGKVLITYPDHSTEEVTVTVNVTPQNDEYTPTGIPQEVDNGHVPDPETSVTKTGLPEGTTVTWKTRPDVSTPGSHPGVALVHYPDGTEDEVEVPVTVKKQSDTFNPTAKEPNQTVRHNEVPDPEKSINTNDLPKGTNYSWSEQPDTSKPGSKTGKVLITYPDKSTEEVTVTVNVTPQNDEYSPTGIAQTVDNGHVPDPETSVNKTGLPEGTTVTWKETPVVNTPGSHPGVALVTYPDGTVDEVTVPITVKEQKDTFNPTAKQPNQTVRHNEVPDPEKSINTNDLPKGTNYSWSEQPDTSKPGSKTGKVLITYPDKSTEEVTVTVEVTPQKDDYDPQPKAQTVDNGTVPNAEDSVDKTGLPSGTTVTWKTNPDVSTPGAHPTVALVTYPDGTADEVTVPITVKEQKDTFNPTAKQPNQTAKHGSEPSAEGSINTDGLPKGTSYTWVEKPDTNTTPGNKPGKVLITYPDKSTEEVTVTVEVTPQKDDYDPQPKTQTVEHAQVPSAKDSIENVKTLPEGTTFGWKDGKIPDTSKHGEKKGVVTVTYPDGSTEDVDVVITVNPEDFSPVVPMEKVPVKNPENLSPEEQDKVKEKVTKANPGKDVTVDSKGNVTITDPETKVSHEISRDKLVFAYAKGEPETSEIPEFNGGVNAPDSPIHEVPEFAGGVNGEPETQEILPEFNGGANTPNSPTHEVPEFNGGVNGELPDPVEVSKIQLMITKWVDENGKELKPADAKAPKVLGEANEAFEHGEIKGYVFVRTETKGDVVTHIFRKVSPVRSTGDGQQGPATPSDDTNPRPDIATPAEVPAAQAAGQPSQIVAMPAQLQNEVSETNPSVSQTQAVLPNTGIQEDRTTGAVGVLSLLGAFGLLFAKKKKDDEEEA